jgi:hypothetical protein
MIIISFWVHLFCVDCNDFRIKRESRPWCYGADLYLTYERIITLITVKNRSHKQHQMKKIKRAQLYCCCNYLILV